MKKAIFGGVGTPVEARAKTRLEYLREQIEKEAISYGEIIELQSLAKYIEAGDVVLLEWAGVPEHRHKWVSIMHGGTENIKGCEECLATRDSDGGIIE